MKKILFIVIILALIVILLDPVKKMKAPPKPQPVPAPQFSLTNLSGKKVSLSDFQNRPIIVNYWATWCVPCRNEMPIIEKAFKQRKNDGLVVLAINLKESKDTAEEYIDKNGFSFQILLDEKGEVSEKFQVFGLPTTYFIDKKGVIQYSYMGEMTEEIINIGLKSISAKGI